MNIHTIRLTVTGNGEGVILIHELSPARSLNLGVDIYGTPPHGFIGVVARIYETDRERPIVAVAWYAHGRAATRAEVKRSIETGLPALEDACRQESTGERQIAAHRQLVKQTEAFARFIPEV